MATRKMAVTDKSFEKAGITKDKQEAICEYIWNGFEADATNISVELCGVALEKAMSINIIDNGFGIDHDNLENTFDPFLASPKPKETIRIKAQANKGKGRFSYQAFAPTAVWHTVFRNSIGERFKYSIMLRTQDKSNYDTSELVAADSQDTGTVVEIPISDNNTLIELSYEAMKPKLLEEFAWFLYLNKDRGFTLTYLNQVVHYDSYILPEFSSDNLVEVEGERFLVSIIVWRGKVDNFSRTYYLSESGKVLNTETTKFNRNTVGFYHAVFIKSDYFKKVVFPKQITEDDKISLLPSDQQDILRQVRDQVWHLVDSTFSNFLKEQADSYLDGIFNKDVAPKFSDDEYGRIRRDDFVRVAKELYCTEPKIFHKLNPLQEQSLLGFLNLLLSSDERESILSILASVTTLTTEQRSKLASILKRTKLEYIIDLISMVERRYEVVAELKRIIYDLADYANERDHIQKIIEQNFWLFGEAFRLVTADKEMLTSLKAFEAITGVNESDDIRMTDRDKISRMDIFLYSSQINSESNKECLVVELKAPKISLSLNVANQLSRYANTVISEPRFISASRTWKFICIGKTIRDEVKRKYDALKHYGKPGLIDIVGSFEIYGFSWDDIFTAFENRHAFLLDKLQKDLIETSASVTDNAPPSRKVVDSIVQRATQAI